MFTFFDYLFYRLHLALEKTSSNSIYKADTYIAFIICMLSMPIIMSLGLLFVGLKHILAFGATSALPIFLLISHRYDKNKDLILRQFEYSNYNKKISYWKIWLCCVMMIIIGFALTYLFGKFIVNTDLNGIIGRSLGII